MKPYSYAVLIAAIAIPALCQEPTPQARMLEDQTERLQRDTERLQRGSEEMERNAERMAAKLDSLSSQHLMDLDMRLGQLKTQFDFQALDGLKDLPSLAGAASVLDGLAFLQKTPSMPAPPAPPAGPKFRRDEGAYDAGTRALDQHKYDEAVQSFDAVIAAKSTRSDGALYWKAYALNRTGKRDDAIAAIAQLRRDYPSSAWLNDAQALEAEVRRSAGQPASPDDQSNEDLKLMALNSLMDADPERAIPLVEGILKSGSAPSVKNRALFVLAQSRSPRAQQVLLESAKGGSNPDLQLRAIQYLGMSGTKDAQQQLESVYTSSNDARVKGAILQSLMMSRASNALISIAKSEKDASLRNTAIRFMAQTRSVPPETLLDLYNAGADAQTKREIIDGLHGGVAEVKTLILATVGAAILASTLFGQQPTIDNAKVETRSFSGTLVNQLRGLGAGPFWAGYSEPIVAGQHGDMCSWNRNGDNGRTLGSPVRLEGEIVLVVLVRIENGQTDKLMVTSPDCHLDGGGLPFYWINNVPAGESVSWLKGQAVGTHSDTAIMAISLHTGSASDQALNDLTVATQPVEVRKRAAFWLGNSRGSYGVGVLKRMLASDPSPDVRDRVVFALSQSKDPAGIPLVIEAARTDKDAHIRGQALFWLAQRAAGQISKDAIQNAITNDPETSVREKAVMALGQMPNGDGIPMLIDLAKTHRDPAVRKKAMFWLGQSKDPRAVEFFAQVLRP
jgi:HEAT repeat protein